MSFLSRVSYPASGAGPYAIPFSYLSGTHIQVYDNGTLFGGTITFTSGSTITLSPAIVAGHTVEIRRVTPQQLIVVFSGGGTIASTDLNTNSLQLLFLEQEISDAAQSGYAPGPGGGPLTDAATQYPEVFGAAGNAKLLLDVVTTSGSKSVSSASAMFLPSDVGKLFEVPGAATGGHGLTSTIAAVNSLTSITLADNAGVSVSGARAWYGTNDLGAIVACLAHINLQGGGRMALTAGKTYMCDFRGVANGGILSTLTNLSGFTFDFAGGRIVGLRYFSIGVGGGSYSAGYLINLVNCTDVVFANVNLEFYQDPTTNAFLYGMAFVIGKGMARVAKRDGIQLGGRMGLWAQQDAGDALAVISRQVSVVNMEYVNTAYPLVCYETEQVYARFRAEGQERAGFLLNCKGVDLAVVGKDHIAEDLLIIAENSSRRLTTGFTDVRVDYVNPGRASSVVAGFAIAVVWRTDAIAGGATARGLDLTFDMELAGSPGEGGCVTAYRQLMTAPDVYANETPGVNPRGHVMEGVGVVRGSARSSTGAKAAVDMFSGWPSGEHIRGFKLDLDVAGSGGRVTFDGAALEQGLDVDLCGPNVLLDLPNVPNKFFSPGQVASVFFNSRRRLVLNSDVTLYFGTSGSDANQGYSNTPTTALGTLQGALDKIAGWDLGSKYQVVLQMLDGTLVGAGVVAGPFVGARGPDAVILQGNGSTPANTILNVPSGTAPNLLVKGGAKITVRNVTFTNGGSGAKIQVLDAGSHVVNGGGINGGTGLAELAGLTATAAGGVLL